MCALICWMRAYSHIHSPDTHPQHIIIITTIIIIIPEEDSPVYAARRINSEFTAFRRGKGFCSHPSTRV